MSVTPESNLATPGQTVDVWELPKLKVLLAAGEAAVNRARYVFLAISIAGALILSAQFNVSIPWIRNVLHRTDVADGIKAHIQEFLWKDLYVVSMPVVGIKFSAFDLGLIGAAALAVLSVWQYYCARRENHVIKAIVQEAKKSESKTRAAYLYHGIAHHFVFMTVTACDAPEGSKPQLLSRFAVRTLRTIPVWVPLFVVSLDLLTLVVPHTSGLTTDKLWRHLSPLDKVEVYCRFCIALLVVAFSFFQCRYAARFDSGTRVQLSELTLLVEDPCAKSSQAQTHSA